MFNFKTVSMRITVIFMTTVLIAGGVIASYMEYRLIKEIDERSRSTIMGKLGDVAAECNYAFSDAIGAVASIRNLAEGFFDIEKYTADPESYFDSEIRPIMDGFVYNIIDRSDFVAVAYFAMDPDLAGAPFVNEVYFGKSDYGIVEGEPQTYDEYMDVNSGEMEWFYGAYDSGAPHWTQVYEWSDGETFVSYAEPVYMDGRIIGIAGVDINITYVGKLVKDIEIYETGFKLLMDNHNEFFETNAFISGLSAQERAQIIDAAQASENGLFDMTLDGSRFVVAAERLANGYYLYALAPRSEFRAEVNESLVRFAIILPMAMGLVALVSCIIGKWFRKPLNSLIKLMNKACVTGDVSLSAEDAADIEEYSKRRDEIGRSISAVSDFLSRIRSVSKEIEAVAHGDLTEEIAALSENDLMGNSLLHMNVKLNEMFSEIKSASEQVSGGARQISVGSQTLAQGSTEQAASVQELSSSISEIAQKTKENADIAEKAANLAESIMGSAEKGGVQMAEMQAAVKDINDASQSIGKIIKTIDDIAFQTNILALNAAVEAARAGKHGKGFAVVAEEVRNLAAKSADAAKETSTMIQNSMDKAMLGVRIADETSASFTEIASGINESGQLIGQISGSLGDQSADIEHINTGIDQVTKVIQQNSATAQESAAASEEMSSQSTMLLNMISQFRLKEAM